MEVPEMNPNILVALVAAAEKSFDGGLVPATYISDLCQRCGIDLNPPHGTVFQRADYDEAAGQCRLLKFKESRKNQGSPVYFALNAPQEGGNQIARAHAARMGWVELTPRVAPGRGWD
jgi:hypothetical protein